MPFPHAFLAIKNNSVAITQWGCIWRQQNKIQSPFEISTLSDGDRRILVTI
jgi:hypothetical protein